MAKAMDRAFRFAKETITHRKIDAGRPQRKHRLTGIHHAYANRPRRVITTSGNNRNLLHSPGFSDVWQQGSGNLVAFIERRHMCASQFTGSQHDIAPVTLRDIQPHCPCRIRHIAGKITSHAQTQVIFRQQNFINLVENLRLVALHPQQFWRGKARHHQVAGDRTRLRNLILQHHALFTTATIVPQNSRTQYLLLLIQ